MIEKEGWLYGVFHKGEPDRCRYLGITNVSVKQREYGHWSNALRDTGKTCYGPMKSWLYKHRDEKDLIEFRVLYTFSTVEDLKAAEIRLIAEYRARGEADLNLTDGGEGGNGWKHTKESKRKLSAAFSGEKNPMYGKDRKELMAYALSCKGPVTDEMKENLSEKMSNWWDENPEKRVEYSNRVRRHWEEGRMPVMTRERALDAVRAREVTLSDEQVITIRELRDSGETLKGIVKTVGVSQSQVRSALGKKGAYEWVSGRTEVEDWNLVRLRRDGLTIDDILRMRRMFDQGVTNSEILSNHYPNLKRAKIQHITSRRGYKWLSEDGTVVN